MKNEEKDLNFENKKVDEKKPEKSKLFSKIKKLVKSVGFEDLAKKVGAGVAAALIAATISGCQPVNNNSVIAQAQEAVEQEQSDGTIKEFFKTYGIKYTPIDKSVLTSGAELVPTDFDNRLPDWFVTEINDQIFIFRVRHADPLFIDYEIYWFGSDRVYRFISNIKMSDPRYVKDVKRNAVFLTNDWDYYDDIKLRKDCLLYLYSVAEGDDKTFVVDAPVGIGLAYAIDEEQFDTVVNNFFDINGIERHSVLWVDEVSNLMNLHGLENNK